ncbi:MAG TPA: Hsp20/alpha crystallin family protein [Nitrospiria bacterium]|nr:Hsp20/alpha crystallin family protein [Nitrospiria bacterium]
MAIVKWDPLNEILTLQDQVNRIFDTPAVQKGDWAQDWVPSVDIFEDREAIEIRAEVPGMDLKDVEVKLDGDLLVLKGEKKAERAEKKNYHQIESVYGRFSRSFALPTTVDRDRIQASYQQGVLKLILPKREESKPRTIAIESK